MTHLLGNKSEHQSPSISSPFEYLDTADALQHIAHEYLFDFGWSARVDGLALHLVLDEDQAAVLVPTHWASAVLDQLVFEHLHCPVLQIPGYAWGFLTACDGHVVTGPAPGGTRVLLPGAAVPLPPTPTEYGSLSWVQPPQPGTGLEVTVNDIATAIEKVIDTLASSPAAHARGALHGLPPLW